MENQPTFNNNDQIDVYENNATPATPPSSTAELKNGERVEVPLGNLAAAKGALAAEHRAEKDDATGTAVNDLAIPSPTREGEIHDDPLQHKLPVYTADGQQLGIVSDRPSRNGHLIVQQGRLFVHDLYVPRDAIARQDATGTYLAVNKDEISGLGWENEVPSQS